MVYSTLLKTIQKMQNSLTLRQQHFLHQRKNLYNQEPLRSSSCETSPEDDYKISCWSFYIHPTAPDFIPGSGAADEAVYKHIGYGTLLSEISGRMALMCRGQEMLARLSL